MTATTYIELATEAQKQALSALQQAQDLSLQAAELAIGLTPRQPADPLGKIPAPADFVEGAFGFAGQVLQQQKTYALRMTELLTQAGTAGRQAKDE